MRSVWKEQRCANKQKRVNIAGLRLVSLQRPVCVIGPSLVHGISGNFPSFQGKNGSQCLNYLEQTLCFMLNRRLPSGSLKFLYMLGTCIYVLGILVHTPREE